MASQPVMTVDELQAISRLLPLGLGQVVRILDNLPLLLRETRRARGLYLYQVAEQTGINISLVCRIENGHDTYHMNQVVPLLRWIDQPRTLAREVNHGKVQPGIPGLPAEPGVGGDAAVEAEGSRLQM